MYHLYKSRFGKSMQKLGDEEKNSNRKIAKYATATVVCMLYVVCMFAYYTVCMLFACYTLFACYMLFACYTVRMLCCLHVIAVNLPLHTISAKPLLVYPQAVFVRNIIKIRYFALFFKLLWISVRV